MVRCVVAGGEGVLGDGGLGGVEAGLGSNEEVLVAGGGGELDAGGRGQADGGLDV